MQNKPATPVKAQAQANAAHMDTDDDAEIGEITRLAGMK